MPIKDKFLRLNDVLGLIKNRFLNLPANAEWVDCFIEECEAFRGDLKHVIMMGEIVPHDDQVDVIAYALGNEINMQSIIRVHMKPKTNKRVSPIWNN